MASTWSTSCVRPEHVALLNDMGAAHVVDSSAETFVDDLTEALRATGATIAFDAIGGGELAGTSADVHGTGGVRSE